MADRFQNKYRIPSARAPWHGYDGGIYFVTICTKNREHYFGEITNETDEPQMQLSGIGKMTDKCMGQMETLHNDIAVPLYQIMPNHIHLIVIVETSVDETPIVTPIVETPYYDVSTGTTGKPNEQNQTNGTIETNGIGKQCHIYQIDRIKI